MQRWLQRDVFEEAGITEQVNAGRTDSRMAMLTTQHRMHPEIAAVVNTIFYDRRLKNGSGVRERAAAATATTPMPGSPLVFYDLGGSNYC